MWYEIVVREYGYDNLPDAGLLGPVRLVPRREIEAGDLVIWLHRVAAEFNLASPRSIPAASSGFVVNVEDVDAHYERARARAERRRLRLRESD